jgi:hypothetical protein
MLDPGTDSSSSSSSSSSWRNSKAAKGIGAAGRSLSDSGQEALRDASNRTITQSSYHRGGKVRKGGSARLLKGERVISKGKVKRVEKMMRKAKMRMKARR